MKLSKTQLDLLREADRNVVSLEPVASTHHVHQLCHHFGADVGYESTFRITAQGRAAITKHSRGEA